MVAELSLGARIRALRERAGIKSQELAAELGIDPSAMSNIERDKRAVKTEELTRIAGVLKVSPLALLERDSLPARMPIAKRHEGVSPLDGDAYRSLINLVELHQVLAENGIPTHPRLDDVPIVDEDAWRRSADELATWARHYLDWPTVGDDRFVELAESIEGRLRVDVSVEEYADDSLIGAAVTDDGFPLIFVNAIQLAPRALFTLAHELGHLLSRHSEAVEVDDSLVGSTPGERFANAFAASFLMPEEDVLQSIAEFGRTAESLARMVDDFGVSLETIIYRLHNLQIIDAHGRDQLKSVGWQGLLAALKSSNKESAIELRRKLVARLGTRPERRPPVWLLERALDGFDLGFISIRPIADFAGEDADDLLERAMSASTAHDIICRNYEPSGGRPSDEKLFEESPF